MPDGVEWAALLEYLGEMGYGEVYLPLSMGPAQRNPPSVPPLKKRGRQKPRPVSEAGGGAPPVSPGWAKEGTGVDFQRVPEELPGTLPEVAAVVAICRACKLCERRNKVVFGTGDPQADLLLIGEGPGAEEDRQGLPFVGPAGQLLTKILRAIDLDREEVYITNVVKCRPPGNRDPQPDEVAACRAYLERQIALIQPKLIVALGRVAAQTLLGTDQALGRLRGHWWQVLGVPTRVTYHPAALLRNTSFKRPTWEDMQLVQQRLGELCEPAV